MTEVAVRISTLWKALTDDEKKVYNDKAAVMNSGEVQTKQPVTSSTAAQPEQQEVVPHDEQQHEAVDQAAEYEAEQLEELLDVHDNVDEMDVEPVADAGDGDKLDVVIDTDGVKETQMWSIRLFAFFHLNMTSRRIISYHHIIMNLTV